MLLLSVWLALSPHANAWDHHQVIMERILDTRSAKQRQYPNHPIKIPCPEDEKKELQIIAKDLHIDVSKVPIFTEGRCKPGEKSSQMLLSDLLTSAMIDEPDMGMDQNLPDLEDPHHFRKWMGGETGPTSQGFRHMYFAGLSWSHPVETVQLPFGPVGEALERVVKMKNESALYFKRGDAFWGTRLLLWELHYVQDLTQPFHVIQIPSIHMLPWRKLFSKFKDAAAHSIGNFHYAYEGLSLAILKDAQTNDFLSCLEQPENLGKFEKPEEIFEFPHQVGNELGKELVKFFGDSPQSDEVDLPNDKGAFDYFALANSSEPKVLLDDEIKTLNKEETQVRAHQEEQWNAFQNIRRLTCDLMKNLSRFTWGELDNAYSKGPADSTSSKSAK